MDRAKAQCICNVCGRRFNKETEVASDWERNCWLEWASTVFSRCPECWERDKDEIRGGLQCKVRRCDTPVAGVCLVLYGDVVEYEPLLDAGTWIKTTDYPHRDGDTGERWVHIVSLAGYRDPADIEAVIARAIWVAHELGFSVAMD